MIIIIKWKKVTFSQVIRKRHKIFAFKFPDIELPEYSQTGAALNEVQDMGGQLFCKI